MKWRRVVFLIGIVGIPLWLLAWATLAVSPGAAGMAVPHTDTATWFTFTLRGDDTAETLLHAGDLLQHDAPTADPATLIEARGFVTADAAGHFVYSQTGERVRFWGVNLSFGGNFPDHAQADLLAARLAKLGFNAVRLHHMDNQPAPFGIWDDPYTNTQTLDAGQLDRLDYFVYQLKQHAIYVDLNLHVSRVFTADDGVTEAAAFMQSDVSYNKNATHFDPVMIGLQQDYARQLLTHVNPYTGLAYRDDPVVFTTETTNEDSLFLGMLFDQLHGDGEAGAWPLFYQEQLDGWSHLGGGSRLNRIRNGEFSHDLSGWYTYAVPPAGAFFTAQDGALRIDISQPGSEAWHIQLGYGQLALQAGEVYHVQLAVRGSQPTTLYGGAMRNVSPWDDLGWYEPIPVTTEWVTHTVTFTATDTVYGSGRISFDLGLAEAGTIWLDHIVFREAAPFRGWLGWLEDRYGSTAAIQAAWAPTDPVPTPELVSNGSFETGLTDWFTNVFGGAQANWDLDATQATSGTQSLRVQVTQTGGEEWYVQLIQGDRPIEAGQAYRVRFDARTDVPGGVAYSVMQNHDPWANLGWWGWAELDTTWQTFEGVFTATESDVNGRVSFDLGQSVRTIWLDNVSLRPFNPTGLEPGESLEANTIGRLRRAELGGYTAQRWRDTVQFYADTERTYFETMRAYVQETLGGQNLNTGTANYFQHLPHLEVMAGLDYVDNHLYWDHPWWPAGNDWAPTGWVINNTPWVNAPFSGLFDLAVWAVEGRPFTVTEFNAVSPNRYEVEGPLLMALMANLQDWDGVFLYSYAHSQDYYLTEQVTGFFDMVGNPIDLALMPIAARIFLGQQTDPASTQTGLAYTQEEVQLSTTLGWRGGVQDLLSAQGVAPAAAFGSRLRVVDFAASNPMTTTPPSPAGPVYISDGGQLTWDVSTPDRGRQEVNAPQVQGVVGFIDGTTLAWPDWSVSVASDSAVFGALLLQSLDGQPLATSQQRLLGALTRFENSGMVWNEDFTSVNDQWGNAPTLVEPLRFTATLQTADPAAVTVWALDATGAQQEVVPHTVTGPNTITFVVDTAVWGTVWYAIETTPFCSNLLANGDFEAGPSDWSVFSRRGQPVICQAGTCNGAPPPYSGDYLAYLGGVNRERAQLWQSVTVPSASPATLSYWYQIQSVDGVCAGDVGQVYVRLGNSRLVLQAHTLCAANNTDGWQLATVDVSSLAGQSVELGFSLRTDLTGISRWAVDEVTLVSGDSCQP